MFHESNEGLYWEPINIFPHIVESTGYFGDKSEYLGANTVNLKFITHKMWHQMKPAIKEEKDEQFSFPYMAEALDNVHKCLIYAEPKPFKHYIKLLILTQNLKDSL